MRIFAAALRVFTLVLVVIWASGSAWGGAVLVESVPVNGEVLARAPGTITLRFDTKIVPNRTWLNFSDLRGNQVLALPRQPKTSSPTDRLTVILPLLRYGSYILRYKVVDLKGESTYGSVSFTAGGY